MATLLLTGSAICKSKMEYHGKFGHTLGRIHRIDIMIRIVICYTACRMVTQTVATIIPCFKGLKICIQYLVSYPHKPIFFLSNSYDELDFIRRTWSRNQVEYYTTQNFLNAINMRIMIEFLT